MDAHNQGRANSDGNIPTIETKMEEDEEL